MDRSTFLKVMGMAGLGSVVPAGEVDGIVDAEHFSPVAPEGSGSRLSVSDPVRFFREGKEWPVNNVAFEAPETDRFVITNGVVTQFPVGPARILVCGVSVDGKIPPDSSFDMRGGGWEEGGCVIEYETYMQRGDYLLVPDVGRIDHTGKAIK